MTRDPMACICSPEMPRRAFMAVIAGSLLTAPLAAEAQPVGKVSRVGVLSVEAAPFTEAGVAAPFLAALRDLGWIASQNIAFEARYAAGQPDPHPTPAADLVRLKLDLI